LDLSDDGFHYSVLSEFRQCLLDHDGGQVLLDEMLGHFREKSLIKARGQQRTDTTHLLAAVRELSRLERVRKLQDAVKFAREESNGIEVAEQKIGAKIFDFIFKP
jgi:hypothetical protein